MSDDLQTLSPLDGRYGAITRAWRDYFSEMAFIRDRIRVEIQYLIALSRDAGLIRELTDQETEFLRDLSTSISMDEVRQVKGLEKVTRHDVKAIETFLRTHLSSTSLSDLAGYVHFGLTSEDVNNIAQALALRDSRDRILLPALDRILEQLAILVVAHKSTPMLARTHGQPASPTTLGKEVAVFYARLRRQSKQLAAHVFEAKLTGAVGNLNAHMAAAPQVDWVSFSDQFLVELGLKANLTTTQILPYDNWIEYFNVLHLINSILTDLVQDLWRYLSDDYLKMQVIDTEVGSSAMPHKVNPIDLENAEGNLGLANSLLEHFARKLPVSRLQRDLSDSTVRRNMGTALGYASVAYDSLAHGLERLEVNEKKMREDLERHWEVITEGAQTILRAAGIGDAYDQLKAISRGQELSLQSYRKWIESLKVDQEIKRKLHALSPQNYLGLAEQIAEQALK